MTVAWDMDASGILTPQELAGRLKVPKSWVYEKTRNRGAGGGRPLPCLRMGRYLRFYWPDVCEWMRSNGAGGHNAH